MLFHPTVAMIINRFYLLLPVLLLAGCAPTLLSGLELESDEPRAIVTRSEAVFVFPPLAEREFAWHRSDTPPGTGEFQWSVRPGRGEPETGSVTLAVIKQPTGSTPRRGSLRELVAAGGLMVHPPAEVTSAEPVAGREDLVVVRTTARPDARLAEAASALVRDGRVILRVRGRDAVRQLIPDDEEQVVLIWTRRGEEPSSVQVPVERR
jgi:hypothetical protein